LRKGERQGGYKEEGKGELREVDGIGDGKKKIVR
jgi:hypothetical protein